MKTERVYDLYNDTRHDVPVMPLNNVEWCNAARTVWRIVRTAIGRRAVDPIFDWDSNRNDGLKIGAFVTGADKSKPIVLDHQHHVFWTKQPIEDKALDLAQTVALCRPVAFGWLSPIVGSSYYARLFCKSDDFSLRVWSNYSFENYAEYPKGWVTRFDVLFAGQKEP